MKAIEGRWRHGSWIHRVEVICESTEISLKPALTLNDLELLLRGTHGLKPVIQGIHVCMQSLQFYHDRLIDRVMHMLSKYFKVGTHLAVKASLHAMKPTGDALIKMITQPLLHIVDSSHLLPILLWRRNLVLLHWRRWHILHMWRS